MILEANTTQFETMHTFLERGGKVFIDSTFGFDVRIFLFGEMKGG